MAKIEKNLQQAILDLPQKEKDKLLIRLIGKDKLLIEKFEFELLEAGETLQERRTDLHEAFEMMYHSYITSPKALLYEVRKMSSAITRHLKITKDKYGEVELTIALIKGCFEHNTYIVEKYSSYADALLQYLAKRTEAVVKKVEKLHPDEQFDFLENLNLLLQYNYQYATAYYAKELKLPKKFD